MGGKGKPFQKGNTGKPKGAVSEKVKFWNELSDFVINEGADKYKNELMQLEGKDYILAYNNILEFFKPKLARQEIKADVNDVTVRGFNVIPASTKKSDSGNSNK